MVVDGIGVVVVVVGGGTGIINHKMIKKYKTI